MKIKTYQICHYMLGILEELYSTIFVLTDERIEKNFTDRMALHGCCQPV
jgi:uncharacterized protein Veg